MSPFLAQIGYEGRPFSTIVPDGKRAGSNVEQWNERSVAARALNAALFGDAFSLRTASAGTRRANLTQILKKEVFVDGTTIASDMVGGDSIADQSNLKLLEFSNDLEFNLLNSTMVTGVSGTTEQRMAGVIHYALLFGGTSPTRSWVTTNSGVTANAGGLSAMQNRMKQQGLRLTDLIVDDAVRRQISIGSSATTDPTYRSQRDAELVQNIEAFRGDFGGSMLHTTYDTSKIWGMNASLGRLNLGIDRSMIEKAWLRPVMMKRIPEREDGVGSVILGEVTLRVWSSAAIQVDWNRVAPDAT